MNVAGLKTAAAGLLVFLPLEQKPCHHSDEDRDSYPYMLLKHVKGGGSRNGLSEL